MRLGYICVGVCSLGNLEAARSLLPLPDLSRKIEVDSAHRAMDGSWCTGFVKEQTLRVTLRAGYKQAYFSFPPPPPPSPPGGLIRKYLRLNTGIDPTAHWTSEQWNTTGTSVIDRQVQRLPGY